VTLAEFISKVGLTFYPLVFLSILSIGTIMERVWFWSQVVFSEQQILSRIMDSALRDWNLAKETARKYRNHPLGRFLYTPLRLSHPSPEVFHLALESMADDELALMRRGDKILEAVIALSPLLGLLGTVLGLIRTLRNLRISDLGTDAASGVSTGIGEALFSTAFGLIVAIASLAFYRLFQGLWSNQVRVFRKAGSELEVIYRQHWSETDEENEPLTATIESPEIVDYEDE